MKFFFSIFIFISLGLKASVSPEIVKINRVISDLPIKSNSSITFKLLSQIVGNKNIEHYYGIQTYQGLEIYGTNFNMSFIGDSLVNFNHHFYLNCNDIIQGDFLISPLDAINTEYLEESNEVSFNSYFKQEKLKKINESEFEYLDENISPEPIKVYKKWYYTDEKLVPIYEISWYLNNQEHWYNTRIHAETSMFLGRDDWVVHCSPEPLQKQTSKEHCIATPTITEALNTQANASYNVFAMPIESPNHGNRSIVDDPADGGASPFGWHDNNGSAGPEYTITRGNNVYASEDQNNDNAPGYSPNGGSSLIFNQSFDINGSHSDYIDAAITNLFYWNNVIHDVWYHYGFDEQSGNFQDNNYGNGGNDDDYVFAEAQDGSGKNNANFATPNDGQNPRMQMYVWSNNQAGDYFQVNAPSLAKGKYSANIAGFGPALSSTPLTGDLVIVQSTGPSPQRGCAQIVNSTALNGKIAFIERGSCTFMTKVRNAEAAGAIAVVIHDSTGNNPIVLGSDGGLPVSIPTVMIRKTDGIYIRNQIPNGVSVSLYDSTNIDPTNFDSDFDNGIICHEYGHGISNRLTGGAFASSCLVNEEQMGEGWSDFFGLVMTHESGDKGTDKRGIGTYVRDEPINGDGIRPYPYSTDKSISPYTYDDIKSFSVPHGVGSVWCSMLWDMYWALIDKHGYDSDIYNGTGGNNVAMQLVIDGLKLQPCSPGFIDGRDAILLADRINNNGANQKLIWTVFAARGLGYNAVQGSSQSAYDGSNGFDLPPKFNQDLFVQKKVVKEAINGEYLDYTLSVTNYSGNTVYDITLIDTLDNRLRFTMDQSNCPGTFSNDVLTISIDSLVNNDSFVCVVSPKPVLEETTEVLLLEDVESGEGNWNKQSDVGNTPWAISSTRANGGSSAWFGTNTTSESDQSLIIDLTINSAKSVMSFYHYYKLENTWDGGVVEIYSNNAWMDAKPYMVINPYNEKIQTNPQSNISGRAAYTGDSKGFINTVINLGSFNGQDIKIRFRLVCDGASAVEGWYVDDIEIKNAVSITNALFVNYGQGQFGREEVITFITGDGIDEVSINELSNNTQLRIYPNPSSHTLNISSTEYIEAALFDIHGKLVKQANGSDLTTINVSDLSSGIYFIKVENSTERVIQKVLISR